MYGGVIGEQYDPCYHEACDTFSNKNDGVLDLNSDAVAFATLTYAMSTETVTGADAAAASALSSATSAGGGARADQLPAA